MGPRRIACLCLAAGIALLLPEPAEATVICPGVDVPTPVGNIRIPDPNMLPIPFPLPIPQPQNME